MSMNWRHIYIYTQMTLKGLSSYQADESFGMLNRDLQRLSNWAMSNFMDCNATQTKYMVVTNSTTDWDHPPLYLDGKNLEKVQTYAQLGLNINAKINWGDHINNSITKANKKLGLIWKLSGNLPRHAVENITKHQAT